MKFKTSVLDPIVLFCFVLWMAQMDFLQAGWHMWVAGSILIAYLVWYAVRLGREKAERKPKYKKKMHE